MQTMLTLDIPPLPRPISYTDNIMLIGSCFTEHISDRLQQHKFKVLSNPNGILFNPLSVAQSINNYIDGKTYTADDLFHFNELWNSWDHHTRFSHINKEAALAGINDTTARATAFIHGADQLIITLGSAFQYHLVENGRPVANNHRAPSQWFAKKLLPVSEITDALGHTLEKLFHANPYINVIFTISPVRHIRDGVVDNNRSKARLIEAVHQLAGTHDRVHYFPAYELIIDILRDYRFYDIDLVHPNYSGTTFVWEHFVRSCIDGRWAELMQQVHEIATARNHRARFPETEAHKKFKASYATRTKELMAQHPNLDLNEELSYFSTQS